MNEIESVAPDLNGLTFLRQKLIERSAGDHFSIGFGVPEAVFRHIKASFSALVCRSASGKKAGALSSCVDGRFGRPALAAERSMITVSLSVIVAVVVVFLLAQRIREGVNARGGCPECNVPVPQFRTPTSFRQAIYGGWTCENCGTEMNMHGARR